MLTKGKLTTKEAVVTSANIPGHVARRELALIANRCDCPTEYMRIDNVDALGGGNIISLRLHYQHCSEVIEHVGKVGLSAKNVARAAVKDIRRFHASAAVVGEHLAGQLLMPMVIGKGGIFRTLKPSLHCKTNRDIIHLFTEQKLFSRNWAKISVRFDFR